jgi:hypothetical protein
MKAKPWKLLESTDETLVYIWKSPTSKGRKFTIFRDEYNNWNTAQLEGERPIDLPETFLHVEMIANMLGLA